MTTKRYDFEYVKFGYAFEPAKTGEGFTLDWSCGGGDGFGQLTFIQYHDKDVCETEGMSPEFVKQAVEFWLTTLRYKDV